MPREPKYSRQLSDVSPQVLGRSEKVEEVEMVDMKLEAFGREIEFSAEKKIFRKWRVVLLLAFLVLCVFLLVLQVERDVAMLILFGFSILSISIESLTNVGKSLTVMFCSAFLWAIHCLDETKFNDSDILEGIGRSWADVSQIIFFLIHALLIVDLMIELGTFDLLYRNFRFIILNHLGEIETFKLFWTLAASSFLLSALFDNLTTTLVLLQLLKSLLVDGVNAPASTVTQVQLVYLVVVPSTSLPCYSGTTSLPCCCTFN